MLGVVVTCNGSLLQVTMVFTQDKVSVIAHLEYTKESHDTVNSHMTSPMS